MKKRWSKAEGGRSSTANHAVSGAVPARRRWAPAPGRRSRAPARAGRGATALWVASCSSWAMSRTSTLAARCAVMASRSRSSGRHSAARAAPTVPRDGDCAAPPQQHATARRRAPTARRRAPRAGSRRDGAGSTRRVVGHADDASVQPGIRLIGENRRTADDHHDPHRDGPCVAALAGRGPRSSREPEDAVVLAHNYSAPGDPGRRRPRRRLPRAVADRGGDRGVDDRLLRRPLHGRDRQAPQPGQDRAHPDGGGRLLAGRHDRRRRSCGPGRPSTPSAVGRRLREHDGGGEGGGRHLLHLLQRGRRSSRRSRPTPRCCSCPTSSSARTSAG